MAEFSKTTQKRITFLSVFETLGGDYDGAIEVVERLEDDGFFEEESGGGRGNSRSSGRSGGSGRRGSSSAKSSRGKRGGNQNWKNDPATDAQIDKAIEVGAIEDGYSEDDLANMTKGEISDLIDELK